jgi:hypothetical protein
MTDRHANESQDAQIFGGALHPVLNPFLAMPMWWGVREEAVVETLCKENMPSGFNTMCT